MEQKKNAPYNSWGFGRNNQIGYTSMREVAKRKLDNRLKENLIEAENADSSVIQSQLTRDNNGYITLDLNITDSNNDSYVVSSTLSDPVVFKDNVVLVKDSELVYHIEVCGEKQGEDIIIPADQYLDNVEYNATKLILTLKKRDESDITKLVDETRTVDLSDLVNIYEVGNGLKKELSDTVADDNRHIDIISVLKSIESEKFLKVDENGIAVKGVQNAIDTAADNAKRDAIATANAHTDTVSTNINAAINALNSTINSVSARISAIETNLNGLIGRIASVESRLSQIERNI